MIFVVPGRYNVGLSQYLLRLLNCCELVVVMLLVLMLLMLLLLLKNVADTSAR